MQGSNIIKIEPSPYKKPSIKIKMETINMAGDQPKFVIGADGKQKVQTSLKDAQNIQRLPGTIAYYSAALTKNGLNTGLTDYVDNPYKDEDFYRDGWEKLLKGKAKIRRQELLEYKHNRPMGYYTNQVTNSIISSTTEESKLVFYQKPESKILLNDGLTILDLENPIHEVNYYMLKAHSNIALSYEDLINKPNATHYIVDELEKQKVESDTVRKYNKLGARLEELMSLPDGTIQDFCKAMALNERILSKEAAYNKLNDIARSNTDRYDEFMSLYEMWKELATRERFDAYVEMFNFITTPGMVSSRNNKYFWNKPASNGGKVEPFEWSSREKFIDFLLAPENQEEAETLRMQYKAKSRN